MSTTLKVTGMTCMHCAGAIKKVLEQVPGVVTVEVCLEKAMAEVIGKADPQALILAIEDEGYRAEVQ